MYVKPQLWGSRSLIVFKFVLIAVYYFKVPLIGWRIGDELVYLAEGASHDTSSIILWAQNMGK